MLTALAAMLVSISSCGSQDEILCPNAASVLLIEVRDAETGAPAALDATGRIQSGDYFAALNPASSLILAAELGPAGDYALLIQKPGYQDWTDNILVRGGNCGPPLWVELRADLQPSS